MSLVYPQDVTLYQVGDIYEGASFNNFLDALDGSYCTYDGGDNSTDDGVYPDPYGSGYGYVSVELLLLIEILHASKSFISRLLWALTV